MRDLNKENQQLRLRFHELVEGASSNQRILEHFQHFELELLSCRSIYSLLRKLLLESKQYFDLDACKLIWFDPENEARGMLDYEELQLFGRELEFTTQYEPFQQIYKDDYRPVLTTLKGAVSDQSRWFPWASGIKSCAMLPLVRQDALIGSLHMGSVSGDRFTPDKAVDFMARLAAIMAICLENCVNQEHLRRLSLIDMLTRAKNRRSFELDLSKELSRAVRTAKPLSCLFIDADHFKRINDTYGHQSGDTALKEIAQIITGQLRQTDHLARYGGEEFAVLLPDCAEQTAVHIAERVRMAAERTSIQSEGTETFSLTLSVGVSTWHPKTDPYHSNERVGQRLLASADCAVYTAKTTGRNRVCFQDFTADQKSSVV